MMVECALATTATHETTTVRQQDKRNPAIDFTRGMLVLLMVVHHTMDYFAAEAGGAILTYARFVAPGFLFMNGYLIARIYFPKYMVGKPGVYKRLLVRAVKLIGLFTVLNLAVNLAIGGNRAQAFFANLSAIYLTGNWRFAAFEVLLPHGYVLLLAIGGLAGFSRHKYSVYGFFFLIFTASCLLRANGAGSHNLTLVSMGFLGMVFGMIPIQKINTWVERRWLFGGLYLCYLAVISVFRQGYLSEPIGVCLNLGILYAIGRRFSNGLFGKRIMLVGNYSLLGYIFHVFVLQLLSRFAGQGPSQTHVFIVAFGVTVLLTWFTIQFVDWMRTRSSSVDAIYKAIF